MNTKGIISILHHFYSDLYKEKTVDLDQINHFLDSSTLTPLPLDHKLFIDKPISAQEVLDTIKQLKSNTAPGRVSLLNFTKFLTLT